jgi:fucose 4-O-acetylase-like acetyltransferase
MAVSPYLSKKIKVLSFLAIYMVLVIHTAMPQAKEFIVFDFFQRFIGDYINRLYLPLFMAISGFLFYHNIIIPSKHNWLSKYKSRFKSLLIPYILWNLMFLLQMAILQYNPLTSPWISEGINKFISSGSILQSVWLIFTVPANLPLWFVRNLMIIVVFTPIIYFSIKSNVNIFLFIIIFLISFLNQFFFTLLFFYIGSIFAIKTINIEFRVKAFWLWILVLLSIIIGVILTVRGPISNLNFYLAVVPLLALWFGYDYLHDKHLHFLFLNKLLPYTFFIYVFHIPALNIFKKVLVLVGNKSELSYFFTYLFSPILMVLLAYFVGGVLKKIIPKTYSVFVGSRS